MSGLEVYRVVDLQGSLPIFLAFVSEAEKVLDNINTQHGPKLLPRDLSRLPSFVPIFTEVFSVIQSLTKDGHIVDEAQETLTELSLNCSHRFTALVRRITSFSTTESQETGMRMDKVLELLLADIHNKISELVIPSQVDLSLLVPVSPGIHERAQSPFTYTPLPTASSIRLIRLNVFPNDPVGVINLSTTVVDLNDMPTYTALSYTWGPPCSIFRSPEEVLCPSETPTVTCDGQLLQIGSNLSRFLMRWKRILTAELDPETTENHRKTGLQWWDERWVWIDAICINQADTEEKNSQVAMMGRIYRQSQNVCVWLGEEDGFTRPAIRKLLRFAGLQMGKPDFLDQLGLKQHPILASYAEDIQKLLKFRFSASLICVFAFLNRSWFHRAWIVQEVALAPKLSVMCGGLTTAWEHIVDAVAFMKSSGLDEYATNMGLDEICGPQYIFRSYGRMNITEPGEDRDEFFESVREDSSRRLFESYRCPNLLGAEVLQITAIRNAPRDTHSQRMSLLDLFNFGRTIYSTDPRDRVYAFLELAKRNCHQSSRHHPSRRDLEVDYHKTVEEVYLDAAWFILLSSGNTLELLSSAECVDRDNLDAQGTMSWKPDWSKRISHSSLVSTEEPLRSSCGGMLWNPPPEPLLHQPFVCVEGAMVGVVSDTVCESYDRSRAAIVASQLPQKYPWTTGDQSPLEVLWRTITADFLEEEDPAPAKYDAVFRVEWLISLSEVYQRQTIHEQAEGLGCDEPSDHFRRYIKAKITLEILKYWKGKNQAAIIGNRDKKLHDQFNSREKKVSEHRAVFRTTENHLGNGPRSVRKGDQVWILAGARVPFVLSPRQNGRYKVIGESYVHGIMHGEELNRPNFRLERIILE